MASATTSGTAVPAAEPGAGLRHHLPVETWVAGCTVLLWVALALASPYFLTTGNIFNIMRQVSVDAIIAYGELFTIITAGIDLSVGSVAGLTGVVFALALAGGMNVFLAVVLVILLGLVIGVVNGLAIDKLGIPAFIVTLAGLQGFRGLTMLVSGGMTVSGIPASLGVVANTSVLGVPTMFVVMLVFAVGSQWLLGATRLGRYMYALGSNIEAARRVGAERHAGDAGGVWAGLAVRSGRRHAAGGAADDGQPECGVWVGTAGHRRGGGGRREPVRRTRHGGGMFYRGGAVHDDR